MPRKMLTICVLLFSSVIILPPISSASINWRVNARSAILIDMERGAVLYEQNADTLIAPASITKILTLYLVFEAIKEGQVRLSDMVEVSSRAGSTGGSRMGLRAHTRVPLEELIKGMAVVSGNDACVAAAEHISGSVERFVRKMNVKARELGMTNSRFMTPNGLPATGQVTTARDISKLSIAYLRRFPESLTIHSMTAYSYGKSSHHNANRLLGKCPGVDGLKTGFVCASGYNISATAKRSGVRVLAVVMGARNPWIRCSEAERLIEVAFREAGAPYNELRCSISPGLASGGKNSGRASVRKAKSQNRGAGVNQTRTAAAGISKGRASKKVFMAEKKQAKTSAPLVRKGKVSAKEKERAQVAAKNGKAKQAACQ
ncbi:MAG: D-alanyl-D-alanine carboxypeptidase family protein [Syntrophobacteraceae bacterium]